MASRPASRFRGKPIKYNRGIIRPTVQGTFWCEVNRGLKRYRGTMPKLPMARDWIDAKVAELDRQEAPLGVFQMRDASRAAGLLPKGVTLVEAAQFWLDHAAPVKDKPMAEAVAEFRAHCEASGLRPRTVAQYRYQLARAAEGIGYLAVGAVTTPDLVKWLDSISVAGRNRLNFRVALSAFFSWAQTRGYSRDNPAHGIPSAIHRDEAPPVIFTAEQVRGVMAHAPGSVAAFLAVGFFAGLRTAEIERTTWEDIGEHIHVTAAAAKKRRQRFVTIMPNLAEWIVNLRGTGRLCPMGIKQRRAHVRAALSAANIEMWPDNVMRHSYASHHLALYQDAPRTAHELGHTNPIMLYNHYRALVTPDAARAYFTISPNRDTKM